MKIKLITCRSGAEEMFSLVKVVVVAIAIVAEAIREGSSEGDVWRYFSKV
jgi:hypothetical protein